MLRLTIDVLGEKQLDRAFSRFGDKIKDFRPVFEAVGKVFYETTRLKFQNNDWKDLSEPYATRKFEKYPFMPILRASDKMFKALTKKGADGNVHDVREREASFGTNIKYAAFHQTGTRRMPQRKIIGLTEENKRDMTRAAQRIMVGIARDLGFQTSTSRGFIQTELSEMEGLL